MSWRTFSTTLHLMSLGVWAGAVLISGATAAVAFPTLKSLGVRLEKLPEAMQAESAFRLAAGAVAQRVFLIADMLSFACAVIAGVTLLGLMLAGALPRSRPATYVRGIAYGVGLASLAALLFVVTPRIITASKEHMRAALAGDIAAAERARAASADLHPIATNLMVAEVLGVLIALSLGAWAAAKSDASGPAVDGGPAAAAYPTPDLAKRGRG